MRRGAARRTAAPCTTQAANACRSRRRLVAQAASAPAPAPHKSPAAHWEMCAPAAVSSSATLARTSSREERTKTRQPATREQKAAASTA